ncbi:uncharacterized protein LOC122502184 isoform X2 [Leptopilina heterotoma]|uniref:uncharacterized protein LOC122502184 isoform X2 n=1 Tax=Leptopilina heterotoma TaxID=63436 RepID=UPI001CA8848A|nr:uncharacterized protein LOC122502184 isoform X2 [Leptopilina heterotoma]
MFFKIRNSFILVCEIIIFCCVLSAFENVNGKCIIYKSDGTEMTENEWSVGMYIPIIDNWTETSLLASRTKNIKSIEVNLNTIRSNYFNIGLDPVYNLLTINLTDEFANYEVYETVEVVEVKINFDCESSGEKSIVISLPITDSNNHDPEFINAPYEFTMGMPLLKNYSFESHGIAIIARDIDISNKNLSFSLKSDNGKSNGFSILWSGQSSDNRNKPIFKAILITTELIDLHENVTFTIAAQDTGQPVRETNTTITINVERARSTLMFSKSLYIADCRSAEVGKDADIVFDQKIVILRGAELNINITILSNPTGYEQNFQYEMVYETSMISLKLKNPPVTLLTMNSMLLELQISKIGSLTSTVLFIKLPGISDSTFPPKLYFKSEFHRLEKDFSFTGTLIAEKADLENVNGDINYSIRYESSEDEKISIDRISGEVKVIKMLSPGIYTFDIIANVTEHNLSARTKVLLVITHKEIDYALRIIEVEEESPHKDILSLGSEFCDYTIQSQTPDKGWFYLVKNSLYSNAIDRESTDFLNYSSAQVRLEIEVICPSNHLNDKQVKRATEYNVAIGNILFNYSQMHIIAIITDINDNEPVWDTQIPKTIGYLAKELSKFVLTPCVYNLSVSNFVNLADIISVSQS